MDQYGAGDSIPPVWKVTAKNAVNAAYHSPTATVVTRIVAACRSTSEPAGIDAGIARRSQPRAGVGTTIVYIGRRELR